VFSTAGSSFTGAAFRDIVVLFPVDLDAPFETLEYRVAQATRKHVITGLTPLAGYHLSWRSGQELEVTVTPGGAIFTDAGGVLVWEPGLLRLETVPELSASAFRLVIHGPIGLSGRIQRSTDLVLWQDWQSFNLSEGLAEVADPSMSVSTLFYRAVAP
jgi:hypothetical protein